MASKIPDSVRVAEAAALTKLYDNREPRMGHRAFAVEYGIGKTAAAVTHYLTNRRPLNLGAATKFAQGLGVSIDTFSPRLAAAAALARSVGQNHMAVVSSAPMPHEAREADPEWTSLFPRIDIKRIRNLRVAERRRLEDAWLVAAALLEIHVAKQAAA
jgi:hypothetical protein